MRRGSSLCSQDTVPGLLDIIGCRDVVDSILDKCGVMCLARLAVTSKSTRAIIDQYNRRTKRIFPVRCGGFDNEFHTFWATLKRELAAEADTPNQPSPLPSQVDDIGNSSTSSPSPSKRLQSRASSTLTPLKSSHSKRPTSNTLSPQPRPHRLQRQHPFTLTTFNNIIDLHQRRKRKTKAPCDRRPSRARIHGVT